MLQAPQNKKLVSVLITFTLKIDTNKKFQKVKVLDRVSYICYLVQFQKNKDKDVLALCKMVNLVNTLG